LDPFRRIGHRPAHGGIRQGEEGDTELCRQHTEGWVRLLAFEGNQSRQIGAATSSLGKTSVEKGQDFLTTGAAPHTQTGDNAGTRRYAVGQRRAGGNFTHFSPR